MKIYNRRYTGSKYKLMPWIKKMILLYCPEHKTLFDVFGGTGVVTAELLDIVDSSIINDFLFSNEIIYNAFFGSEIFDEKKLKKYEYKYNSICKDHLSNNYVSDNYGNKYFKVEDAKLIGFIRDDIQYDFDNNIITKQEFYILIASLLYSLDKCANTVGHYDAYIKKDKIRSNFVYELIEPICSKKFVTIFRQDANELVKHVKADVAFIDPPYNSRQYSRFYHVLETITKWDKPVLSGVAMKPPKENMSDYCRSSAVNVFSDLINNLNVKYIVVTYNNTYDSKSSSSKNKITLEQINEILNRKGQTMVFEKDYHRFNAGKTDNVNHKEILFITKVNI